MLIGALAGGLLALHVSIAAPLAAAAAVLVVIAIATHRLGGPDAPWATAPVRARMNQRRMLTARPATSTTVITEIADSESINRLARLVSGIASVGLNAMAFVNET